MSLGSLGGSGQEPGKGTGEGGAGQDVAGATGLGRGPLGSARMHLTHCCSEIRGQGSWGLLPGGSDSISLSLRAPLGSEVQQDQEAPLVPQGVQAHKVPLEQQERKASR